MAEPGPAINPIEQFELSRILTINIGQHHYDISITNSTIVMAIIAIVSLWLMSLTAKSEEVSAVKAQFDSDIERYRELHGRHDR